MRRGTVLFCAGSAVYGSFLLCQSLGVLSPPTPPPPISTPAPAVADWRTPMPAPPPSTPQPTPLPTPLPDAPPSAEPPVISGQSRRLGATPPYLASPPSGEMGTTAGAQKLTAEYNERRRKVLAGEARRLFDVPYVDHQWIFSEDGAISVLDTYHQPAGPGGRRPFVVILAAAPAERMPVPDDLECHWRGGGVTKVTTNVFGTRFERISHPKFGGNVFEDLNNFVMRCDVPRSGLSSALSLSSSSSRSFRVVDLRVTEAEPWPEKPEAHLTLCTSGVWGLGGARFITEYLEHSRRMGVDFVDYYSFDGSAAPLHKRVLEHYVRTSWMRLHDWSPCFGSDTPGHAFSRFEQVGWSRLRNWQHAQIFTRNDCYWRNRRRSDYIIITDIDELPWAPTPPHRIYPDVTSWADSVHRASGGDIVGFSLKNHVWPPHFQPETEGRPLLGRLLYEQEAEVCPYNCGEHHQGRWKWMLRTRDENDVPIVHSLWYHAISHTYVDGNYNYYNRTHLREHMRLVPPERAKLRHMVNWKRMPAKDAEYPDKGYIRSPLPVSVVDEAQARIAATPDLAALYRHSLTPEEVPKHCRASIRVGLGIFCQ
eukprot:TRINITY_DN10829_c0_g6_i1.p1 TRINITY_DN10829_c0_g6~~TRINITY_DN10829_c0_g6_i1.p1  ORF type:complete len:614 (+),score=145.21 TRINITY_DN10829_c0_g6_i1:61-1842(+)